MLLQSIELKNFRQFENEKIEFSTDPDKNVTLVIGENGTGKTTFAQAFFWCLYGETDFSDKIMLNRVIAEQMTPDETKKVSVMLRLIHGSANYELKRTQEYKKSYAGKVSGANTVLNIAVKTGNGNTRYLKPLEVESEVKKILSKELASYFFFDGERIEKMSKEISSGRKSSGFYDAVAGLTGLKGMLSALGHLSPTKQNSVIGRFTKEYSNDSSGRVAALTSEIEKLQTEIDSAEARLQEIADELSAARNSKIKFKQDIKQYEDGEKLQNERDGLNKQLSYARQMRAQFVKDICTTFNAGMPNFVSMSLTKRALEILSKSDFCGKDIPEMHSKTIKALVARGTCICGTHLDPGTIPYTKVMELLDFLPPQSIGVTVSQFVKDSRAKYIQDVSLMSDISEKLTLISGQDDAIRDIQEHIDLITAKLDGDDVREQVKNLDSQIRACDNVIRGREQERSQLEQKKGACSISIKKKEESRSRLLLLDENNQRIEKCKTYAIRIYEEMLSEYNEKEKQVRERLQTLINEIFLSIYDGGLSLSIDEKYNITVNVTNISGVETSQAQSISVIFAFISSIIKMARDNQKDNDGTYSEPYPLVMDAPLSAFDKRRIKAICSTIPEIAEQVIIFIKDTDGDLAEEHLGVRVGARRHFEKIDEFHTKLS